MLEKVKYESGSLLKYIKLLVSRSRAYAAEKSASFKNIKPASMYVVARSLGQVSSKLQHMEQTNFKHRQKMQQLKFEELPDAASEPEKIIAKGQLSILYLKGYETLPASAIVSILLENLFKHRQEVEEEIPPFLMEQQIGQPERPTTMDPPESWSSGRRRLRGRRPRMVLPEETYQRGRAFVDTLEGPKRKA